LGSAPKRHAMNWSSAKRAPGQGPLRHMSLISGRFRWGPWALSDRSGSATGFVVAIHHFTRNNRGDGIGKRQKDRVEWRAIGGYK